MLLSTAESFWNQDKEQQPFGEEFRILIQKAGIKIDEKYFP